jgi:hypothetical protein
MSDMPPAPTGSYRRQDGRRYVTLSLLRTLLGASGAVKYTLEGVNGAERKLIL